MLVAAVALAAAHSSVRIDRVSRPSAQGDRDLGEARALPPTPVPHTEAPRSAAVEPSVVPEWLVTVAVGLVLLAVLAAVGLLLRTLLRDWLARRRSAMPAAPLRPTVSGPGTAAVVAAVDAGLVDLDDADHDPRRAVIACWVRLEQTAAAAGVPREIGDTPTDLVTRLLARRAGVSAEVLTPFAEVYRQARYATHTVDERMRAQARDALHRLRAELTVSAGGGSGRDE